MIGAWANIARQFCVGGDFGRATHEGHPSLRAARFNVGATTN